MRKEWAWGLIDKVMYVDETGVTGQTTPPGARWEGGWTAEAKEMRGMTEFPHYSLITKKLYNAGLSSALDFKSNADITLTTFFTPLSKERI